MKTIPIDKNQTIESYKKRIAQYCDELEFIAQQPTCPAIDKSRYMASVRSIREFLSRDADKDYCEATVTQINKTIPVVNKNKKEWGIIYKSTQERVSWFKSKALKLINNNSQLTQTIIQYQEQIDCLINDFPCNEVDKEFLSDYFAINEEQETLNHKIELARTLEGVVKSYNLKHKGCFYTPGAKDDLRFINEFVRLINIATKLNPKYAKKKHTTKSTIFIRLFSRCIANEYCLSVKSDKLTLHNYPLILSCTDFIEMPKEWDTLNSKVAYLSNHKPGDISLMAVQNALSETLKTLKMGVQVFQADLNWLIDSVSGRGEPDVDDINILLTKFMASLCANRHDPKILTTPDYVEKYKEEKVKEMVCKAIYCCGLHKPFELD